MNIVAFTGWAGSGKTTAASILSGLGFQRESFAAPIRKMLQALGVPDEYLGRLADKDAPIQTLCGRSFRHAAQTLGTEWGRNQIGNDIWANALVLRMMENPNARYVIDDMRMLNEEQIIRSLGGKIVRIIRPHYGRSASSHQSETEMRGILPDAVILNDGDSDLLRERVLACPPIASALGNFGDF